jgi:hypothetical protein
VRKLSKKFFFILNFIRCIAKKSALHYLKKKTLFIFKDSLISKKVFGLPLFNKKVFIYYL